MRIQLGLTVECSDGPGGTVGDVVIDPVGRAVTHIVVEPRHHHRLARLVPIGAFDPAVSGSALRVGCTSSELAGYPQVEETAFVRLGEWPEPIDGWEIGVSTVLAPSYDSLGLGGGYPPTSGADRMVLAYDRIPAGEVELRRRSAVKASDGEKVGHVEGFLAGADGRITHLVLERGHLWGRHDISIPIEAVKHIRTDCVELDLTVDEVSELPSIHVRRRHLSVG